MDDGGGTVFPMQLKIAEENGMLVHKTSWEVALSMATLPVMPNCHRAVCQLEYNDSSLSVFVFLFVSGCGGVGVGGSSP